MITNAFVASNWSKTVGKTIVFRGGGLASGLFHRFLSTATSSHNDRTIRHASDCSVAPAKESKRGYEAAGWQPSQPQTIPYPVSGYKDFDPAELKASGGLGGLYGLLVSSIVPRPIAVVTSQDSNGLINCAPFSYFNIVSHDPPVVMLGCAVSARLKMKKDTLKNIEDTGEYVANILSSWYVEAGNHASGDFPHDVNEIQEAGLTAMPSEAVRPPRLAEAAVQFECKVFDVRELRNEKDEHTSSLVLAKIVKIHVHNSVLAAGCSDLKPVVDSMKFLPVGRLGGNSYSIVDNEHILPHPVVQRPDLPHRSSSGGGGGR